MTKEIKQQLDQITKSLINRLDPERIILFGSYAYGKPHKDSDLDLLIIKNTQKRTIDRIDEARQALPDNRLVGVDLLVYTNKEIQDAVKRKNVFVRKHLLKGKQLYVKN